MKNDISASSNISTSRELESVRQFDFFSVAGIRQDNLMPSAVKIPATTADGTVIGQLMIYDTLEAAQIAADVLNYPGPELYGVFGVSIDLVARVSAPADWIPAMWVAPPGEVRRVAVEKSQPDRADIQNEAKTS